jgi:hypothetical protein
VESHLNIGELKMSTLSTAATNRATYPVLVTFTDSNGDTVEPTSVVSATWSLTDEYGNIINNREDIEINLSTSPVYIILSGDDIDIENSSVRYVTVDSIFNSDIYGNGLSNREQAKFLIGDWVEPEDTV